MTSKAYKRFKRREPAKWKAGILKASLHNFGIEMTVEEILKWMERTPICDYCNLPIKPRDYSVDHILPRSKGGSNEMSNLHLVCFPAGALVHTSIGLKKIESVTAGDLVLTHKGRYMPVTRTMVRPYKGELVVIRPFGSPTEVKVTPKHRFYVSRLPTQKRPVRRLAATQMDMPSWKYASSVTGDHFGTYPIIQLPEEDIEMIDLQNYSFTARPIKPLPLNQELCELLGWYLSEGHVAFSRPKRPARGKRGPKRMTNELAPQIIFSLGTYDEMTHVKRLVESLGLKGFEYHARTAWVYGVSTPLGRFVKEQFGVGSHEKRIPLWAKTLPQEKIRNILRGYEAGDGAHLEKHKELHVIDTASMQLAYDVRDLALRVGYVVSITRSIQRENRDLGIRGGIPIYRVMFRLPTARPQYQRFLLRNQVIVSIRNAAPYVLKLDPTLMFLRVRQVRRLWFEGKVYNLEVDVDNSYVVDSTVVHNCKSCNLTKGNLLDEEFRDLLRYLADKPEVKKNITQRLKASGYLFNR